MHLEHATHDKHEGHSPAMFRDRALWSLLLTLPIVLWSPMIQEWFGYTAPTVPGADLIPAVLGTVVFVYGGSPFLLGGAREIRARQPGMMLLIAMAISVAFGASLATAFDAFDLDFWWELALLIDVMLIGHWQEMKAIGQASSALDALAALLPDEAEIVRGDAVETVAASSLVVGDVVVVRPGGRVPADGTIVTGVAAFDESMITGESRATTRREGDRVVAGTVATDSGVRLRVNAVGEDTALAGIRRLVAQAQASRSRAQALADRAAALLFYVALAAAALTAAAWVALGEPDQALERTVTVLVIACPHALGLAIPLVISISTAMSARAGILVRDRLALERMRTVDTVVFDKTGTLTQGSPAVTDVFAADGNRDELLRLAASVEADSEHPIGRAIVAAAGDAPRSHATGFRSIAGRGVEATVGGRTVSVGGPALLRADQVEVPGTIREATRGWAARGATVVTVLVEGRAVGAIAVEDAVRPASREAVRQLAETGVRVAMV
ncbi:MAG TPA: heavy metal translocating P-type ATPase, partial [Actinomycetota bacterium]